MEKAIKSSRDIWRFGEPRAWLNEREARYPLGMPRLLVCGIVCASALGDLLQYYAATELLRRQFPNADLTLAIPGGYVSPSLNPQIHLIPGLDEITGVRYVAKRFGHMLSPKLQTGQFSERVSQGTPDLGIQTPKRSGISDILNNRFYHGSSISMRYIRPAIARLVMRDLFSAVIVGGHTIESTAFLTYVINYFASRCLSKGPLITFPISISKIGIRVQERRQKLLRRALGCFDRIYVRGPHSYEILREYVPKQRIGIALDSGFAIRTLLGPVNLKKRRATRLAIVPRIDYFSYFRPELHDLYMGSLAKLVQSMLRKGVEIYLVPQSLSDETFGGLDDVAAIHRLLDFLGHEEAASVNVFRPKSLADTYRLFGSMDLVISGRLHGGIIAMSAGSPVLFLLPAEDVKVLDVLASLDLCAENFLVDIFDAKQLRFENLESRVNVLLDDITNFRKVVERSVKSALPQVELPTKTLAQLLA